MSAAPRVVFDCNIFVQALASPDGPSGRCVQLALDGKVQLFVSPVVLREVLDVTRRPKVIKKLRIKPERVDLFVEAIEIAATILDGFPQPFVYERDPADAHYVNVALAARATLIASRDRDLLDLMDVARADSIEFQHCFPTIRIVDPVQFLTLVAGSESDAR